MNELTRAQLTEKYAETLRNMAEAGEEGDKDVLLDKLIYMARKEGTEGDTYYVPEDFDKEAFLQDLARLG